MIEWSPQEEEAGVERGVLYLDEGVFPWNGLVDVTEHGDDSAIQTDLYYDGNRFAFAQNPTDFSLGVSAWSYPKEFESYEGLTDDLTDRQPRKPFNLSYREGKYWHLVWNVMAIPTDSIYSSKNNEFEISQFTWEFVTRKNDVPGAAPSAHFVIDLSSAVPDAIDELEYWLYGSVGQDPTWQTPQEVLNIFAMFPVLIVTDNGDGTATITGPDEAIETIDAVTRRIRWPSVRYISETTVNISSM
jgi:hypothetical protein